MLNDPSSYIKEHNKVLYACGLKPQKYNDDDYLETLDAFIKQGKKKNLTHTENQLLYVPADEWKRFLEQRKINQ